jgi:hypothetical protein
LRASRDADADRCDDQRRYIHTDHHARQHANRDRGEHQHVDHDANCHASTTLSPTATDTATATATASSTASETGVTVLSPCTEAIASAGAVVTGTS